MDKLHNNLLIHNASSPYAIKPCIIQGGIWFNECPQQLLFTKNAIELAEQNDSLEFETVHQACVLIGQNPELLFSILVPVLGEIPGGFMGEVDQYMSFQIMKEHKPYLRYRRKALFKGT